MKRNTALLLLHILNVTITSPVPIRSSVCVPVRHRVPPLPLWSPTVSTATPLSCRRPTLATVLAPARPPPLASSFQHHIQFGSDARHDLFKSGELTGSAFDPCQILFPAISPGGPGEDHTVIYQCGPDINEPSSDGDSEKNLTSTARPLFGSGFTSKLLWGSTCGIFWPVKPMAAANSAFSQSVKKNLLPRYEGGTFCRLIGLGLVLLDLQKHPNCSGAFKEISQV